MHAGAMIRGAPCNAMLRSWMSRTPYTVASMNMVGLHSSAYSTYQHAAAFARSLFKYAIASLMVALSRTVLAQH